jgi:glucan phosphoethanolaminetransferase (alkaline phosphatase superfamily)
MNNDVFDYHIYIEQFSSLLIWLMLVCFLGLCITGFAMIVISRFFLTKTASRFSIIDFEMPFSFTKFKGIIENTTDNTKETIRMNLKMDYSLCSLLICFYFLEAGMYYSNSR